MMLLAIGMAVAFSSHAQLLTKAETSLDIEYTNSEQKLSLDEVKLLDGDLWSELKTDRASFGYTTDEYWFRFQLKDSNIDRELHIASPLLA